LCSRCKKICICACYFHFFIARTPQLLKFPPFLYTHTIDALKCLPLPDSGAFVGLWFALTSINMKMLLLLISYTFVCFRVKIKLSKLRAKDSYPTLLIVEILFLFEELNDNSSLKDKQNYNIFLEVRHIESFWLYSIWI